MSKKECKADGWNVFQGLGLPNAGQHFVKAQLVYNIDTILKSAA